LLWVATTPEAGQVIKLTPWVRTKVDGNPSDPGSAPSVSYQDNSKAVRINNGDSNPVPVRVDAGYGVPASGESTRSIVRWSPTYSTRRASTCGAGGAMCAVAVNSRWRDPGLSSREKSARSSAENGPSSASSMSPRPENSVPASSSISRNRGISSGRASRIR
jgi:hypothetical protein